MSVVKLGSGQQWYSWIHIDDLIRGIIFTIDNKDAHGPFNLTAPIPERQNLFGYTLARAMHKPHETWAKISNAFSSWRNVNSCFRHSKVLPNKLHALGFEFKFNNLKNALDDLVKA